MQFSKALILSFLSVAAVSAYPGQYDDTSIYAREALPEAYYYGYEHTIARRAAENRFEKDFHKAEHEVKDHKDAIETGICTVGAFIPGADVAIDAACLGIAGAQAAEAAYHAIHHKRNDVYARAAFVRGLKDLGLL
ncbi:hypothetical protein MMC34_007515 [Xylographa carneopallida]|nr:hypothetical protein [Xylographa carneopallida]